VTFGISSFSVALGRPIFVTAPFGHVAFTQYDSLGRVQIVADALGNSAESGYDAAGNPIKLTETEKTSGAVELFVTTRTFDALGRLLSETDPGGHTKSFDYDEPGHVVSQKDAGGNVSTFIYDGAGRRSDEQYPESRNIHYDFDGDGLTTAERDGDGHVTGFAYDEAGRRTKLTYADGKTESWAYNPDGTVKTHTDANGSVETLTYDAKDRPTRVAVARGAGVVGATYEAMVYDGLDRVTHEETDSATGGGTPEVSIDRAYGNGGALSSETEDGRAVAYTLDVLGRTTDLAIPDGGTVGRAWDAIDRPTALSLDGSSVASFTYRGPSRIDTVTRGSGVVGTAGYDSDRRLTSLETKNGAGTLLSFTGTYDARHLILSEDRGGTGDAFAYDKAARLTQAGLAQADPASGVSTAGEHFVTGLDPADNWGSLDLKFGSVAATPTVSLNARNQYTSFGAAQSFDLEGNLTSGPQGTFKYDFKNRLVEADLASGTKLFYVYDPMNRLVEKTTEVGATTKTEETLWEGWEPLARYVDGTLTEEDVSLGAPDSLIGYRVHNADSTTSFYNLHTDLRGNTAGVTDQNALLVERDRYTPYGEVITTAPGGAVLSSSKTSRLFQGLSFDADLGWYYARNRYYDPREGRFVTQDPLGLSAGQNLYAFVGDGPTYLTDPMGLLTWGEAWEFTKHAAVTAGTGVAVVAAAGALVGSGIVSAPVLVAGAAVYGGYQVYRRARERLRGGQADSAYQALGLGISDVTGLTAGAEAFTGEEVGTGRVLSGRERAGRWGDVTGIAFTVATAKPALRAGFRTGAAATEGLVPDLSGLYSPEWLAENPLLSQVDDLQADIRSEPPDPYAGIKQASAYLRAMGVSRADRVQYLQAFVAGTVMNRPGISGDSVT
jgi:RHS repeat-associated protein